METTTEDIFDRDLDPVAVKTWAESKRGAGGAAMPIQQVPETEPEEDLFDRVLTKQPEAFAAIDPTKVIRTAEQELADPNLPDDRKAAARENYINAHVNRAKKGTLYKILSSTPSPEDFYNIGSKIPSQVRSTLEGALGEYLENPVKSAISGLASFVKGGASIFPMAANVGYTLGQEISEQGISRMMDDRDAYLRSIAEADLMRYQANLALQRTGEKYSEFFYGRETPETQKIGEFAGSVAIPLGEIGAAQKMMTKVGQFGEKVVYPGAKLTSAALPAAQFAGSYPAATAVAYLAGGTGALASRGRLLRPIIKPAETLFEYAGSLVDEADEIGKGIAYLRNPEAFGDVVPEIIKQRGKFATVESLMSEQDKIIRASANYRSVANGLQKADDFLRWSTGKGTQTATAAFAGGLLGGLAAPTSGEKEAVATGAILGGVAGLTPALADAAKKFNDVVNQVTRDLYPEGVSPGQELNYDRIFQSVDDIMSGKKTDLTPIKPDQAAEATVGVNLQVLPEVPSPSKTPSAKVILDTINNLEANPNFGGTSAPVIPTLGREAIRAANLVKTSEGKLIPFPQDPAMVGSTALETFGRFQRSPLYGTVDEIVVGWGYSPEHKTLYVQVDPTKLDKVPGGGGGISQYLYTNITPDVANAFFADPTRYLQSKLLRTPNIEGMGLITNPEELASALKSYQEGSLKFPFEGSAPVAPSGVAKPEAPVAPTASAVAPATSPAAPAAPPAPATAPARSAAVSQPAVPVSITPKEKLTGPIKFSPETEAMFVRERQKLVDELKAVNERLETVRKQELEAEEISRKQTFEARKQALEAEAKRIDGMIRERDYLKAVEELKKQQEAEAIARADREAQEAYIKQLEQDIKSRQLVGSENVILTGTPQENLQTMLSTQPAAEPIVKRKSEKGYAPLAGETLDVRQKRKQTEELVARLKAEDEAAMRSRPSQEAKTTPPPEEPPAAAPAVKPEEPPPVAPAGSKPLAAEAAPEAPAAPATTEPVAKPAKKAKAMAKQAEPVEESSLADKMIDQIDSAIDNLESKTAVVKIARKAAKEGLIEPNALTEIERISKDRDMGVEDVGGELRSYLLNPKPATKATAPDVVVKVEDGKPLAKAPPAEEARVSKLATKKQLKEQKSFLSNALGKLADQAPETPKFTTEAKQKAFDKAFREYSQSSRLSGSYNKRVAKAAKATMDDLIGDAEKVTIEVPGDGTFKVPNGKSYLEAFDEVVSSKFGENLKQKKPKGKKLPKATPEEIEAMRDLEKGS